MRLKDMQNCVELFHTAVEQFHNARPGERPENPCAEALPGTFRPRRNFGRTSGDKKKDPLGVLSDYISGGRDCRSSPFHGLPTGSNQTAVIGYTEGL